MVRPQLEPVDEKHYGDQKLCDFCGQKFFESETNFKKVACEGASEPLLACNTCYMRDIESQDLRESA